MDSSSVSSNDATVKPSKAAERSPMRPQFSLRTFLILAILVSAPVCYFASFVNRANREREILEFLSESGGEITFVYDSAIQENGTVDQSAVPPGPEWIKALFGNNLFAEVVRIKLEDSAIENLEPLRGLRGLQFLELKDCINLRNLQGINNLPELDQLRIDTCHNITTLSLGDLRSIHRIDLLMCDGLKAIHLGKVERVPFLFFSYCSGLKSLDGIEGKTIDQLTVEGCSNFEDLAALSKVKRLNALKIMDCPVSDLSTLNTVEGLTKLKINDLNRTDLEDLTGLNSLEELNLVGCRNLEDISGLFGLEQLASVRLPFENSKIESQVAELRKRLPHTKIAYSNTSMAPLPK